MLRRSARRSAQKRPAAPQRGRAPKRRGVSRVMTGQRQEPSSPINVDSQPSPVATVASPNQASTAADLPGELIAQITSVVTQNVTRELTKVFNAPSNNVPGSLPRANDTIEVPVAVASLPSTSDVLPSSIGSAGELSDPFVSSSLAIDSRVTDKIKQKIWNHEYVDFGALLVNPTIPPRYKVSLDSSESQLTLEPADKVRKITTIESWLTAFHVFVGVYTSKYSSEAPALMKYGSLIRDLAARGQNWSFYDENFRFMRQTHVHSLPWGSIHSELWLRAHYTSAKPQKSVSQSQPRRNSFYVPPGFCVKYHNGNFCPGCRYKHSCPKCNGNHVVSNCTFRNSSNVSPKSSGPKSSSNTPLSAKSSNSS